MNFSGLQVLQVIGYHVFKPGIMKATIILVAIQAGCMGEAMAECNHFITFNRKTINNVSDRFIDFH